MPKIKLIVDGGNMKPGPAVAQQLGPMGVNLGKVIEDVNSATAGFKGMKVPVELDVDAKTKNYTIYISSPPVAELIKKELGIAKASGQAGKTYVGNLGIEQVISIAKTKHSNMLAKDLSAAVNLVVGSCVSLGVLIEGKNAVEFQKDISQGVYSKEIKEEKTEVSQEKKQQLAGVFSETVAKQEAAAKAAEAAKAEEKPAEAATPAATATPATAKKDEKPAKKK